MFSFVGNLKLFIMEVKELRIGNILLCAERDIPYRVTAEDILVIDDGSSKSRPVPLTEEMLLKCGYATCSFRDNHFVIKGHTIWKCKDLFMCDKNGMVLKHLHQLQNLYFALTNEELTINL